MLLALFAQICRCWPPLRSRNSLLHRNHDYNMLWSCGQSLPEAKFMLFLMGTFQQLVSWETGSSGICCQERSLNHWALNCETIENQSLTNWYLGDWKCTDLLASSEARFSDWVVSCTFQPDASPVVGRKELGWIDPEEKQRWIKNYFLFHKYSLGEQWIKAYQH